jgi:glycosyltransferase involved in cell wall biosynthesis
MFYRASALARATERRRASNAARILRERGCQKIIIYLWRPEFAKALDLIDHDLSCYHLDDEYSFSRHEMPFDPREVRLIERVDHVFLHSPILCKKKSRWNANTHLVPMGADYQAFSTPRAEPEDLKRIPRPRIGYVGYIKGQLNLPLLTTLAKEHADLSFVFVGPLNANIPRYASELESLRRPLNVHVMGERHVANLPDYMQHMDVLTLGYKINDYTKFISPMKLHEYLATGRPVVGSPIPYLRLFPDVVSLAETETQWSAALRESLRPEANSRQRVEQRQRVAKQYDWGRVVLHIAWTICRSLGDRYVRRLAEAYGPPPQFVGAGLAERNLALSHA